MRINRIVSKDLLASPDLFDNKGCFIVLESFLCGVKSMEITIYNFDKRSGPFSDHGVETLAPLSSTTSAVWLLLWEVQERWPD